MNNSDMPAMPVDPHQLCAAHYKGDAWQRASIGLTKREHFAGIFMQALLSHHGRSADADNCAHDAIEYTNALLKALEQD